MKQRSRLVGLVMFGVIAWLFFVVNREAPPQKSEIQTRFERWLESADAKFAHADKPETILPALTLKLSSLDTSKKVEYLFSSSDSADSSEKIFRILEVAEGANLFTDTSWADSPSPSSLALEVSEGTNVFKTHIPWPDDRADVRLRTMFKLFQLYALSSKVKDNQIAALSLELVPAQDKELGQLTQSENEDPNAPK